MSLDWKTKCTTTVWRTLFYLCNVYLMVCIRNLSDELNELFAASAMGMSLTDVGRELYKSSSNDKFTFSFRLNSWNGFRNPNMASILCENVLSGKPLDEKPNVKPQSNFGLCAPKSSSAVPATICIERHANKTFHHLNAQLLLNKQKAPNLLPSK